MLSLFVWMSVKVKILSLSMTKLLTVGAAESYAVLKMSLLKIMCFPALQAHAYYERKYPLVSALSRPIIAKRLLRLHYKQEQRLSRSRLYWQVMTKFVSKLPLLPQTQVLKQQRQHVNGSGLVRKKLSMLRLMVFQFQQTLIILTSRSKPLGTCQRVQVFSKTPWNPPKKLLGLPLTRVCAR